MRTDTVGQVIGWTLALIFALAVLAIGLVGTESVAALF